MRALVSPVAGSAHGSRAKSVSDESIFTNTSIIMHSHALTFFSNIDSRAVPGPAQTDRPSFQEILITARKGLRSFVRDILGSILEGSLAEAAS
jgi:hypothetical protein